MCVLVHVSNNCICTSIPVYLNSDYWIPSLTGCVRVPRLQAVCVQRNTCKESETNAQKERGVLALFAMQYIYACIICMITCVCVCVYVYSQLCLHTIHYRWTNTLCVAFSLRMMTWKSHYVNYNKVRCFLFSSNIAISPICFSIPPSSY